METPNSDDSVHLWLHFRKVTSVELPPAPGISPLQADTPVWPCVFTYCTTEDFSGWVGEGLHLSRCLQVFTWRTFSYFYLENQLSFDLHFKEMLLYEVAIYVIPCEPRILEGLSG